MVVLEKFHEIPFTNKKVACRRQAMQRVTLITLIVFQHYLFSQSWKGLHLDP